jgi:hypothetical protein
LAYFALVAALQPPDHLAGPDWAPGVRALPYDDYDDVALILRGLNDRAGRPAGRKDNPPELADDEAYSRALDAADPPAPTYFLEYPHGALPLFRLGLIFLPDTPLPAALLDSSQWDLLVHQPRNGTERALWRGFRLATQIYAVLMLGCLFGLLVVMRAGYGPGGALATSAALVMLPATLYFTLFRFDVVPALLTALSLACLGRRRHLASGAFLAAGVMIKVYPVLLAPLVLRYLWPDRRAVVRWLTAAALTSAAFLLPPLLRDGWQAVWSPYRIQLSREPSGPTAYGCILPESLADNTFVGRGFRLGTLALTVLALASPPLPNLASLLRRSAVVLIGFVSLAVFYSPQWVLWLTPLLLPLAAFRTSIAYLVVALDLVTFCTWPGFGPYEPPFEFLPDALRYARFVILAALVVALVWPDRTGQTHEP